MVKIYELKPVRKVFEDVYEEYFMNRHGKKLYSLSGYLWLLEKVIRDFSRDNKGNEREVIFNKVFVYLDERVSFWITKIYDRGKKVGEEKLKKYMAIADRLEEITGEISGDSATFEELRRRKEERMKTSENPRMTIKEEAEKYWEAIRVPFTSLCQLTSY